MDEEPCSFCRDYYWFVPIGNEVWELQEFEGHTVDLKMHLFIRTDRKGIDFIPFDSPKGKSLLKQMHQEMVAEGMR